MASLSANATKRILRDLRELNTSPLPGITVLPLEDDLSNLHVNITVVEGPSKGLVLHMILGIPPDYPQSSPSGKIAPGFKFGFPDHAHVFNIGICNDFLSNFDRNGHFTKTAGAGWTSSITLKTLLMILQPFFADVEYSPETAARIENDNKNFTCICGHSFSTPYPPIDATCSEKVDGETSGNTSTNSTSTTNGDKEKEKERALDLLVCSVSKLGLRDDLSIILGYPLHVTKDRRDRIQSKLIPEMLSYDQYALEIQKLGSMPSFGSLLRSATGQPYNCFIPLYINEDNFKRAFVNTTHAISVISNGYRGTETNDFKPEMVLRVLPALINQTIVAMMNGNMFESETAIHAYCYLLRLLMRFIRYFNLDLNARVENFLQGNTSKTHVPDIGEFIIILSLSKYKYVDPTVQKPLLQEYFARQVFWIEKAQPNIYNWVDIPKRLNVMFHAAEVSNKLLVFNIVAAKTFIFPGVEQKLDSNYGMPPQSVIQSFVQTIKSIKAISNYQVLMQAIQFTEINSQDLMVKFLNEARQLSRKQKYT